MAKKNEDPGSIIEEADSAGMTWAAALKGKKRNKMVVPVVIDGEVADRLTDAKQKLDMAQRAAQVAPDVGAAGLLKAETEMAEAMEEAEGSSFDAVFVALGREELRDMQLDHPPTAKQSRDHRKLLTDMGLSPTHTILEQNEDTYTPALLAASIVDPKLTVEEATELWHSPQWSQGDLDRLVVAARTVNQLIR